ncbi:hypothetical protein ScalyP_jg4945, partial [Parmales sp. scaly parma]
MQILGVSLVTGENNCAVENNCFSNYNSGATYSANEDCEFLVVGISGQLVFKHFGVGTGDHLNIGGEEYSGSTNPSPPLTVSAADEMSWHSNSDSQLRIGFEICILYNCPTTCSPGSGCLLATTTLTSTL